MRQELVAGRLTPVHTSHHTTSLPEVVVEAVLPFVVTSLLCSAVLVLGAGTGSPAAL